MSRVGLLAILLTSWLVGGTLAQVPRASTLQWPGTVQRSNTAQAPHPSVVRIYVAEGKSQSIGSGTLIDVRDQYGLVITNWHVIRDAIGEISIVFPDGFRSAGRVVRFDKDWDLAAVSIWRPQAAPVPVALEQPRPGEMLTIAGYGSEGQYRAVTGACTQYLAPSDKHPYELVELAASARQGDSGGPIFNARGELAGVLFGSVQGTTAGSYGGRVWKFVEPLLQPGAAISAPEKPASQSQISMPVAGANTAPPLIADPEKPAMAAAPSQPVSLPPSSSVPLEPVVLEHGILDSNDAPSNENGSMIMHAPFPYRTSPDSNATITLPNFGFNANSPTLQDFLGHSPMEQAKAVFSLIGLATVVSWLYRWNQASQSQPAKKH